MCGGFWTFLIRRIGMYFWFLLDKFSPFSQTKMHDIYIVKINFIFSNWTEVGFYLKIFLHFYQIFRPIFFLGSGKKSATKKPFFLKCKKWNSIDVIIIRFLHRVSHRFLKVAINASMSILIVKEMENKLFHAPRKFLEAVREVNEDFCHLSKQKFFNHVFWLFLI